MDANPLNGFSLRLSGGQAWQIMPAADAVPFVEQLASIMGLKDECVEGAAKLIYTRTDPCHDGRLTFIDGIEGLPKSGWAPLKYSGMALWQHPDVPHVICNIGIEGTKDEELVKMSNSLYPIYKNAILAGSALIHAALVERAGRGVLLAASGGTGKSTCSVRIPRPWRSLGDDLAFAMPDGHGYNAHPLPTWSNFFFDRPQRSWNVQEHMALDAFFFLEQAKEESVEAIGRGDAAMRIYNSSMQICTPMFRMVGADSLPLKQQIFNNACDMSKAIPSYILRIKLTGCFWEEMDRVLL